MHDQYGSPRTAAIDAPFAPPVPGRRRAGRGGRQLGFGSPVGIAILLVGLGAFLALLGEAVALPLSLFR